MNLHTSARLGGLPKMGVDGYVLRLVKIATTFHGASELVAAKVKMTERAIYVQCQDQNESSC